MQSFSDRSSERGTVLMYIMIAIMLFGALSVMVSKMMEGDENAKGESATIQAGEVLSFAHTVRETVRDMMISNGCSDTELSFEKAPFDGSDADYDNPNAPSDFSCHVFHPNGGGITYAKAILGGGDGVDWFFGANRMGDYNNTKNSGSSAKDLTMLIGDFNLDVCEKVNDILGNGDVWESGGAHNYDTEFIGDYANSYVGINVGSADVAPLTGCFCDGADSDCPSSQPRYFYSVILVR